MADTAVDTTATTEVTAKVRLIQFPSLLRSVVYIKKKKKKDLANFFLSS